MNFPGFRRYVFSTLRNEANVIIHIITPLSPSIDPLKIHDLEWLEWPFYVKFSLLQFAFITDLLHRVCLCTWSPKKCRERSSGPCLESTEKRRSSEAKSWPTLWYSITYCLIAFPLTTKVWPKSPYFALNSVLRNMFGPLTPGFRSFNWFLKTFIDFFFTERSLLFY